MFFLYGVQKHGGSSRLFDFGLNAQNGTPNQQGTEWRERYLELQDLFVHEVLHQMPSLGKPMICMLLSINSRDH